MRERHARRGVARLSTHWRKWQQVSELAMEIQARCQLKGADDLKKLPGLANLLNVKLTQLQQACDCQERRPENLRARRSNAAMRVEEIWGDIREAERERLDSERDGGTPSPAKEGRCRTPLRRVVA